MQMSNHVEAVAGDLSAVAAAGDDEASAAAERLLRALEPSLRLHLFEALTEAAGELEEQLPGRIEVRLSGQDVVLSYVEAPGSDAGGPTDDDLSARITLRLPERLKGETEAAAAAQGMSLNAWLLRAARESLQRRPPGRGLRGYARS